MPNLGLFRKYTDIPAAPALSSPVTIIPSDEYAQGFFNMATLLGSTKNAKMSGNFQYGFNMRDAVGSAGTPIILVNTAGDIIGSAILTTHAIQTNNLASDYVYLYGLSDVAPFILRSQTQNGIQLGSKSGGSHFIVRNAVIDSPGASGITANFSGSSQANTYENIDISFVRSFNSGQEGICYIGHTNSTYDVINYTTVHDCLSYNSSREGTQFEHINNLLSYKNTCILPGQTGGAGQNGMLQIHDLGPGSLVRDSIYDGGPEVGTAFTHGTTVRNCYFRWTNSNPFFIGDATTAYFAGNSTRLSGQPQLYDSCIFHNDNVATLAQAVNVAEVGCNIEFRNCIFSNNITALYLDTRSGSPTNSLIGTINTNGNSKMAITAPTYISNYSLYSDYTHHGLCTSSTYLNLRMGYRTVG